jgi:hypothetical protein
MLGLVFSRVTVTVTVRPTMYRLRLFKLSSNCESWFPYRWCLKRISLRLCCLPWYVCVFGDGSINRERTRSFLLDQNDGQSLEICLICQERLNMKDIKSGAMNSVRPFSSVSLRLESIDGIWTHFRFRSHTSECPWSKYRRIGQIWNCDRVIGEAIRNLLGPVSLIRQKLYHWRLNIYRPYIPMMKLLGWGTANFGFTPYGKRFLIYCQSFGVITFTGDRWWAGEKLFRMCTWLNQVHQAPPSSDLCSSGKWKDKCTFLSPSSRVDA